MKVLVVGGGGREHAVVSKLSENFRIKKLFCAPGNAGISKYAECVEISPTDIDSIVEFCLNNSIDLVVVTPDDPLVLGLVDRLEEKNIKAFGPNKVAAQLEGSKIFAKKFMEKYNINTAAYREFSDYDCAVLYIKDYNKYPIVIKADGLALGKGVIIAQNFDESILALKSIMKDKIFGEGGNRVIIEEYLEGVEVSVLAFTDGTSIKPIVSCMDHKKIGEGEQGLNTGGMGVIAPNPYYTDLINDYCLKNIFERTLDGLKAEKIKFKGVLYFGLMIVGVKVYVIEYNCRFGDPEAQVSIPLLKTDLLEIFEAVIEERLGQLDLGVENKSGACVILASEGYPQKYEKDKIIKGIGKFESNEKFILYHSATKFQGDEILTNGGRVLGVVSFDQTLRLALDNIYKNIDLIEFDGVYYRKDIGKKALDLLED